MTVYHGTTKKAAQSIKAQGLKPNLADSFRLIRDDGQPITLHAWAYVTPDKKMAESFARFRTAYERARYGAEVNWGKFSSNLPSSEQAKMVKLSKKRQASAVPAVVELELPDTWESRFLPDPSGPDDEGLVTPDVIPAQYVSSVEVLQ